MARTPHALVQWVHVDVDMCFSYIQLRANRIKNAAAQGRWGGRRGGVCA